MSEKKLNGTVIVTYRCNARCSMCNRYKAPSKPEEEITLEYPAWYAAACR